MPTRTYSKQRSFVIESDAPPPTKKRRLNPDSDTTLHTSSSPAPEALLSLRSSSPPVGDSATRNASPSRPSPPSSPISPPPHRSRSPLKETSLNIAGHEAPRRLRFLQKHTSSAIAKPTRRLPRQKFTQLTIDLGGSAHRKCGTCGMNYLPANPEDSALHKRFHLQNIGGIDVSKAFLSLAIGSGVGHRAHAPIGKRGSDSLARYILTIDARSGSRYKKLAERVLEVVESELGAVPISTEQLWSVVDSEEWLDGHERWTNAEGVRHGDARVDSKTHPRYRVFLYVLANKCVGLCLSERIKRGYEVLPAVEDSDGLQSPGASRAAAPSSSITTSQTPSQAEIGISRIWVSSTARLQGTARTLLDAARHRTIPGRSIRHESIAFSQPTDGGGRLARKWFGKENGWLVYVD